MTSLNLIYFLKALSPDNVILKFRVQRINLVDKQFIAPSIVINIVLVFFGGLTPVALFLIGDPERLKSLSPIMLGEINQSEKKTNI